MKKKEKKCSLSIEDLTDFLTNLVFPACLSLKKDTFADRIEIVCGNLDALLRFYRDQETPVTTHINMKFSDQGDRYHVIIKIKVKSENDIVLSYQEYCVFTNSKSLLKKWSSEFIDQVEELNEKYGDVDTDDEEEDEDE